MTEAPRPPHLLHVFSTFCPAGPQVRTVTLMHGWGASYRHTIVACDNRTEASQLIQVNRGVEVAYRPFTPGSGPMAAARYFRELIAEVKPDALATYNWGAMDAVLAAKSMRFGAHVHHEDGFNADETDGLKGRRNWTRRLSLRSSEIIVPSAKLEGIAKKTWRLPRVHLIPNGVDAELFANDPAKGAAFRERHGISADAFVIGTVGHLRPVKNFGRLIRAAAGATFPDGMKPHLVIVGDGPERAKLEAIAQEVTSRIQVTFTGHTSDLVPAYSAFDVFSLSSDSEQQPVSLLEAMAAGVPAATTDVGDISRTLPPEARVHVVPLGVNVEATLGAAFSRLAASKEKRDELARLGLERVRAEYSHGAMIAAYQTIFSSVLGG
ncbi:Putative glycosyltransferase EpsF [Planctomycetes bacterium Poly30]|uniref:Glycosyltransferase EpsF n=1 Tax=Saltatorellus ferox TaxID=2528018 RepID=A0A518ES08_9BACT|nr:Putative glycosyltransferase EpsF [Planctomycetes bacterium Poly30]